jgi:hypothetical protein
MAADTYVIESITNPSAFLVPNFGARMPTLPVNTAELHALVAYLLHAP